MEMRNRARRGRHWRVKRSSSNTLRLLLPRTSKTGLHANSSDSESEEIATVTFKAAASRETTHESYTGMRSFDYQAIKNALVAGNLSALRAKQAAEAAAALIDQAEPALELGQQAADEQSRSPKISSTNAVSSVQHVFTSIEPEGNDKSSISSSSEEEEDNPRQFEATHHIEFAITSPFAGEGISVIDDSNPIVALSKILAQCPFDPHAPQLQVKLIIKSIVSLTQLSLREDNVIELEIKKSFIEEYSKNSKNDPAISPIMDFSHINVMHSNDEFFTFCSCKKCLEYREIVIHIMVDQFKAAHMVVMLLDVLIKAYGPMLRNITAYNKFEKLLDANKEIYWITWGFVYNKKSEHMDFIYDETLTDNMIFVLFSSILMVNNPLQLLQILSFHVECVVKAYAEGFLEIVDPDNNKIPAEEMLTYILDGFDDLCRISEQISSYLFAFENDFLRKFSLTWNLLCQRLYQQYVYVSLTDTMLACIITLKEDDLTFRHASLIRRYIKFDDKMHQIEKRWTDIWVELNKFNLSEVEQKRRKCLLDVYHIFDTVVQDALAFSLQETGDENDFYDFQSLGNRRLAWQNIMAYTRMKWPDGFFQPPNTFVCDEKCRKCNIILEYHVENCKCITCSIAGGPLAPKRNSDGMCYKCCAQQTLVEKEVNIYDSKLLNVCASDDTVSGVKSSRKRKCPALEELGEEVTATLTAENKSMDANRDGAYHIAWAVFSHLNNRRRYRYASIAEKYFCSECDRPGCLLARKILNNEISHTLSMHLIRHYQPLSMSRDELRSILPNIIQYNQKMIASNIGLDLADVHDLVVKIYWTFIMSLYATYFMEFDIKCPLQLENFEISNNDIRLRADTMIGNEDDMQFVDFLHKLKSFASTVDVEAVDMLDMLEDFLQMREKLKTPPLETEAIPPSVENAVQPAPAIETPPKKNSKEKSKKCCFDHPEMGEHCKENHTNKKRVKKECNHARINETRDRLRKKLSQLMNARKSMKTPGDEQNSASKLDTQQPLTLKPAATAVAGKEKKNPKIESKDDSLDCLNSLCNRMNHLHTSDPTEKLSETMVTARIPSTTTNLTPDPNLNSLVNSDNITSNCNHNFSDELPQNNVSRDPSNGLNTVDEIYDVLNNHPKDQTKVKKWIKETLSFIEGSENGANGKTQPRPTNPKKAAKKAKQKMRKEEEKRITELYDLRGHFQDIYFKEFVDKQELKSLKLGKKRDKKRINELEVNVKKLQRAKSKVEGSILELIATVKQTNTEFKFTYLPTKEQQIAKLREMELSSMDSDTQNEASAAAAAAAADQVLKSTPTTVSTDNSGASYGQASHYPSHMDFQAQSGTTAYGMLRPPMPTPICYAPPQHQQLAPDVVAAMTSNTVCSANIDPSKRIVTIRRVNMPNIAEPQVTVTAKGSSPDKDKLLYTFVNGQLVQTGTAPPPMTQLPSNPVPPPPLPVQPHRANVRNQVITIPPPPLSKAQVKKERKRLAKLSAERAKSAAAEAAIAEQERQQHLIELQNKSNKSKANNQKRNLPDVVDVTAGKSKKKAQKNANGPTTPIKSAPTGKANNTSLPQSQVPQQRLASSPSCSGGNSSTPTPHCSAENTRDNSVSSVPTAANNSTKVKQAERAKEKSKPHVPQKAERIQQQPPIQKSKNAKQQAQQTQTKDAPPSKGKAVNPPTKPETISVEPVEKQRTDRPKRPKVHDSGQFDNNPFKSLHMQDSDSDSEWDGESLNNEVVIAIADVVETQKFESEPVSVKTRSTAPKAEQKKEVPVPAAPQKPVLPQENRSAGAQRTNGKPQQQQKRDTATTIAKAKQPEPQPVQIRSNRNKQSQQQEPPQQSTRSRRHNLPQQDHTQLRQLPQVSNSKRKGEPNSRASIYSNEPPKNKIAGKSTPQQGSGPMSCQPRSMGNPKRHQSETSHNIAEGKLLSKRAQKQAQRSKKFQKPQHNTNYDDSSAASGIPEHMGYFNANEVVIPSMPSKQKQPQQQQQYSSLSQQMHALRIDDNQQYPALSYASVSSHCQSSSIHRPISTNVSIMDQLNRGVQVENLSLPPGITLTKVDPVKSEQLRQKSESIKKLSKPLQSQSSGAQMQPQSFHHPGATIIAPPVASVSSYYGAPYAGVAAAAALDQSGIIMVEANPPATKAQNKSNMAPAVGGSNAKASRNKKRRNKSKQVAMARNGNVCNGPKAADADDDSNHSRMITLRNPMFHGATTGPTQPIIQQPGLVPSRPLGGLQLPAPLPMDQPAAIIKNENGMFTIRNPALHQAVTNGLAMSGYRQFGNVSYYTPQEAAAEATRATQQSAANAQTTISSVINPPSFSYFSNSSHDVASKVVPSSSSKSTHNTISISCTSIDDNSGVGVGGVGVGISGDGMHVDCHSPPLKCISAIGSEVKSAQQQKQKCKENQWSNFGSDLPDSLGCGTSFLSGGNDLANTSLQDKYHQSSYYNGFSVFPAKNHISSNTGSLFETADCHMHHNCGDDSPPPTITGYNAYLEGIPNTGIIRYEDATFLKNLIPGQNLNNEVSVHNINDSNFVRNANSPIAHRVEITPIYGNRPTPSNVYCSTSVTQEQTDQRQKLIPNTITSYRDSLAEYGSESNIFGPNTLLNLNELDSGDAGVESFKRFNYDFEAKTEAQATGIIDLNELIIRASPHSHRTSPYLDDTAMDSFVQNISSLQISGSSKEQGSQLNGSSGADGDSKNSSIATNISNSNGWW